MQIHTKVIVLRTVRYGDAKMVVDMFTESHGRLSFAVTVSKTGRGRMRKQLFQPLMLLEAVLDYRPNRQLQRLADVRLQRPLPGLLADPCKVALALFLAEFISYATRCEQQNVPLFRYMACGVEWLDGALGSVANFHVVFMLRMVRFLGFEPNMDTYADGRWLDMRGGVFTPLRPLHPDVVEPAEARLIPTLMRIDYRSMHLCRMSRQERNRCVRLILDYCRLHLPSFPELRSLDVLSELWS